MSNEKVISLPSAPASSSPGATISGLWEGEFEAGR